jgi:hypothetical protein
MTKEIDWNNIDWQPFFDLVHGTDLGDHKEEGSVLFNKAFFLELNVPQITDDRLTYVNEKGYDFVGVDGLLYEMKCMKNLCGKGMSGVPVTPVTLKNKRGSCQNVEKTFDYMIAIDTTKNLLFKCSWEDLDILPSKSKDSEVKAKLPKRDPIAVGVTNPTNKFKIMEGMEEYFIGLGKIAINDHKNNRAKELSLLEQALV